MRKFKSAGTSLRKVAQALLISLGAAMYLYMALFRFPGIPFLLTGDQVYFWMNGQRMLYGEHVYLDFFQFTAPGTDLFYFLIFKMLGPQIWVTNAVVLLVGLTLFWLCFRLASLVMARNLAILAAAVFLVVVYGSLLNATHHWFSMVFITVAITVLLQRRTIPRIAVAGALVGLASFFTQTHGVVSCAVLGIFLLWERFQRKTAGATLIRQEGVLIVAFMAAVLTLNAHYLATVGLSKLWYFQFTHVREYKIAGFANPLLGLPQNRALRSSALVVYVLVSLTYLFGLFRIVRFLPFSRRVAAESESRIVLLVLVGAGLFVEVLFSLNWLRLYAVCMPAIVLLARAIGDCGKMRNYAVSALLVTVGCFAAGQIWSKQASPGVIAMLPGGAAVLTPQASEKLQWIAERTAPGDFFFQASWPGLYIPLALRNPLFLDTVSPYEQTRPEYIEGAVIGLEKRHVRYILWSRQMDEKEQPGLSLAAIRDYVRRQYRCAHVFTDGDQMLERKTTPQPQRAMSVNGK